MHSVQSVCSQQQPRGISRAEEETDLVNYKGGCKDNVKAPCKSHHLWHILLSSHLRFAHSLSAGLA